MNSIKIALKIAEYAHKDQVDKAGVSYINHPIMVSKLCKSKKAKIVALLHDVIEDSNVTIDDLKPYFTNDILQAILCVTKEENYDYENYLRRIKNNPLAKEVKIADLTHNMDLSRLSNITEDDLKRYEKYKKSIEFLKEE